MDSATIQLHIFLDKISSSDLPKIMRGIEKELGKRGDHQDIIMRTEIDGVNYNLGKLYGKDIVMFKNDQKFICSHGYEKSPL